MPKKSSQHRTTLYVAPSIFEASLSSNGAVMRGARLTQAQAEIHRQLGYDIVVCGSTLSVNRSLAAKIEQNANGRAKRCPPHESGGRYALPHYQPVKRPPSRHTFYETDNRQAF